MENECNFVSSRGLAKICSQHPHYDSSNGMNYSINTNVEYGETVYVDFKILRPYITQVLNQLQNPVVIVCGNDDNDFPDDFKDIVEVIENHKNILCFWCQNCTIETNKIKNIPIGLDYHSMSYDTPHLVHGQKHIPPTVQETQILEIKNDFLPLKDCKSLCIANFHLAMDMYKRERVRLPAYNKLKNNSCIKFLERQSRTDYMKELKEVAFAICPSGNGLDTHRLWETIVLGRIPIVNKTGLKVYKDLPILEVEDWEIINEEWLSYQHKNIVEKYGNFNMEKVYLNYWKKLFSEFK
jgi:hypothetical protein